MTTSTTHGCDRCGTTATLPNKAQNRGRQPAGWGRIVDSATPDRKAVDLCPRCARGHRAWLGIPTEDDDQTAQLFGTDDDDEADDGR